jgi:hypothetical protein
MSSTTSTLTSAHKDFSPNPTGVASFMTKNFTNILASASLASWAKHNFGEGDNATQRHTNIASNIINSLSSSTLTHVFEKLFEPFVAGHELSQEGWLRPDSDDVWLSIQVLFENNRKAASTIEYTKAAYAFKADDFVLIGSIGDTTHVYAANFRKDQCYNTNVIANQTHENRQPSPFGRIFTTESASGISALLTADKLEGHSLFKDNTVISKLRASVLTPMAYAYFEAQDYSNHDSENEQGDYQGALTSVLFVDKPSMDPVLIPSSAAIVTKITGTPAITTEGPPPTRFATTTDSNFVDSSSILGNNIVQNTSSTTASSSGLSPLAVVGIILASLLTVALIVIVIILVVKLARKPSTHFSELSGGGGGPALNIY